MYAKPFFGLFCENGIIMSKLQRFILRKYANATKFVLELQYHWKYKHPEQWKRNLKLKTRLWFHLTCCIVYSIYSKITFRKKKMRLMKKQRKITILYLLLLKTVFFFFIIMFSSKYKKFKKWGWMMLDHVAPPFFSGSCTTAWRKPSPTWWSSPRSGSTRTPSYPCPTSGTR